MGRRGRGYVVNLFLVSQEGKNWWTVYHAARYCAVLCDVVPLVARLGVRLVPLALLYVAEALYSHAFPFTALPSGCLNSPLRSLRAGPYLAIELLQDRVSVLVALLMVTHHPKLFGGEA